MVKIGSQRLSAAEIAANIVSVVPTIIVSFRLHSFSLCRHELIFVDWSTVFVFCYLPLQSNLPGKWNNLQSIALKTADSVALPLWNAVEPSVGLVNTTIAAGVVAPKTQPTPKVAAAAPAASAVKEMEKKAETKKKEESAAAKKSEAKKVAVPTPSKTQQQPEDDDEEDEDDDDDVDLSDMDEESFEQMLAASGLELPDDEQDEELEDGSDDEEEEAPKAKSGKKAAVAAVAANATPSKGKDKAAAKETPKAQVPRSSLAASATKAREEIASRPKNKVAAAKAAAKQSKNKK